MFVTDETIVYSASDLATAAQCEYALLRDFDARLGWGPIVTTTEDELFARTSTLGADHEQRHLDQLRHKFGDAVAVIGRPANTRTGFAAAAEATQRAIANRAPAVYQATVFDGRFVGFADFLLRDGDRYRIVDTKLARSPKVTALLQLAAYADALAHVGVPVTPEAELRLGNGTIVSYRVCNLIPVYRYQRALLQRLLDRHYAAGAAVCWEDNEVRACLRCPQCTEQLRATDDLLLIAGMRVSQRDKLLDVGITTITELANHSGPVPDLSSNVLSKLTAQAKLQIRQRDTGIPQFEIVDPQPLTLLPKPDPGDLFFDFEGDPLWTADGQEWGLEYLFGILGTEPAGNFHPLWAHNRIDERKALTEFLAMVAKRRKRRPQMHIYHYAPYEKTALLRLAGRYGVGEDEVDELLRSGTLVDLYPLVRKSIRVGAESFSLKALEPLYMGAQLRAGDVTTAADSITGYGWYCELRTAGRSDEAETVLKEIENYNHYDCRSTRELRNWLLLRAHEAGIIPTGAQPVFQGKTTDDSRNSTATLPALSIFTGDAAVGDRTPEQTAIALVAAACGYYQREDKPFWWKHFDRLNFPVDEWSDNTDVFIADDASVIVDWHTPPRARKPQRRVRLRGGLARGELSSVVFALYEPPSSPGMTAHPNRRTAGRAEVVEADDPSVPTEVVIVERVGNSGKTFHQLPFALTPGPPIATTVLRDSIESTATALAASLPQLPRTALIDILLRREPRTRSGAPLPRDTDTVAAITAAVLDLDSSYLAIHGPPGTGKTHTAAHVITRLVSNYAWRIGVVAQSHTAVENLLDGVIAAGLDARRVAKKRHGRSATRWQEIDGNKYPIFIADPAGCVIGGTAWDFANRNRVPPGSLDLLIIDEAGQFCLANTIAVAPAAANLMLLGDPQQLPQVSQGTHPEPVDTSALNWLVDGQQTLPDAHGYFLDRSYRMHPTVCAAVSTLSYEGRLHTHAKYTAARYLDEYKPGVHVLTVHHQGNSTESPEEADAITAEIERLLGTSWTDEHGTRPLDASNVLVLAPYNTQVTLMRQRLISAGLGGVRVGTVDKFQGGQAPIVFISMTASSADMVPRGISFLLNRNRLNVAVSRAQYAAVIVRSETLTDYLPATPVGLIDLGAFLMLAAFDAAG
ncbi:nuclease [Mycobacterium uberis]|uniref:Nuclease n=1 Tax=Mycobacterium uberis TaxID=2162698 RepID=A0A3E1HJY5_9MYCO|nr:TM0106 family RecB-like putative nuclease [Mycobacterium uberis]RFD26772.1 nuclease [Mycobacterium uberis]